MIQDDFEPSCDCCGKAAGDCICPECPQCKEVGNPYCYNKGYLRYSREQMLGQQGYFIAKLENQLAEAKETLRYLEAGGEVEYWDNPNE